MRILDNRPQCIITGCVLQVTNEHKWVNGDLHLVGDAYVFNACMEDEKTAWVFNHECPSTNRSVSVDSNMYFERRGLIVFATGAGKLNSEATAYIYGKRK